MTNTCSNADPSLLQSHMNPTTPTTPAFGANPVSPALSHSSSHGPSRGSSHQYKSSRSQSPFVHGAGWQPYPQTSESRKASIRSHHSGSRSASVELDEGEREKSRCPFPECGKIFKDLKAHMLTHQNERPEKCPIPTCEYNQKGFARKYDKNRHTLTHYKGTMVCGFCPHSGSAAEKSFNRADVFKRHLMTVHGVEQNPPNSRKKTSPAAAAKSTQRRPEESSGKCSICGGIFQNAQDFYEHLEDCVLSVVQKIDPSEAINEKLLSSINEDEEVQRTLERNNLPSSVDPQPPTGASLQGEDEDLSETEHDEAGNKHSNLSGKGPSASRKDDPC